MCRISSSSGEAIRAESIGKVFSPLMLAKRPTPRQVWRLVAAVAGLPVTEDAHRRGVRLHVHRREAALEDISFGVEAGEMVAVTGAGEAGKSVLLRILAGVMSPTHGRIVLRGRIGSLLGRKDGIRPLESALENAAHAARLAGIRKPDRAGFAAEVIEFSGLEGFEQVPVQHYSTGMQMRLAVAMTLRSAADILLIDDVLRVGDIAFQSRCREELAALRRRGATVVFVSSDDAMIARTADRVLTLHDGRLVADERTDGGPGGPGGAVDVRRRTLGGASGAPWSFVVRSMLARSEVAEFTSLELVDLGATDGENGGRLRPAVRMGIRVLADDCRIRPLIDAIRHDEVAFRSVCPRELTLGRGESCTVDVPLPSHLIGGRFVVSPAVVVIQGEEVHSLKDPAALTVHPHVDAVPGAHRSFDQPEQRDAAVRLRWWTQEIPR